MQTEDGLRADMQCEGQLGCRARLPCLPRGLQASRGVEHPRFVVVLRAVPPAVAVLELAQLVRPDAQALLQAVSWCTPDLHPSGGGTTSIPLTFPAGPGRKERQMVSVD